MNLIKLNYLNDGHFGFEPLRQLVQHFTQQLLMLQCLAHLHNPNNCRLHQADKITAILVTYQVPWKRTYKQPTDWMY